MRRIIILVVLCLLMPACKKSRKVGGAPKKELDTTAPPVTTPRAQGKTAAAPGKTAKASGQPATVRPREVPAKTPTQPGKPKDGKDNVPKPHAVPLKDGPALGTVLTKVKTLDVASPQKAKATAVKDPAVIKAVLAALNTSQTLRGGRKGCTFTHGFILKDTADKDLGAVMLCGPLGANSPGLFSDNVSWKEWQITIPDGKALAALLDRHLPAARRD